MIDSDSLKALLAALSEGECRNNSDQPEHQNRCLDAMIDSDSLKALLAALSEGECQNNSDQPEHWNRHLDMALRSGLQLLGFARSVFHTDAL
jgi:hypothetical protein